MRYLRLQFQKGQISIPLAAAITGATMLASAITSYMTGTIVVNDRIAGVDKKSEVNANSINLLKESTSERLDRIDDKLEKIYDILRQGNY